MKTVRVLVAVVLLSLWFVPASSVRGQSGNFFQGKSCISSVQGGGNGCTNAFDNNTGTYYGNSQDNGWPVYLTVDTGVLHSITSMEIIWCNQGCGNYAASGTISGSTASDSGPWTTIHSWSGFSGVSMTFTPAAGAYQYYRLDGLSGQPYKMNVVEWRAYGSLYVPPTNTPTATPTPVPTDTATVVPPTVVVPSTPDATQIAAGTPGCYPNCTGSTCGNPGQPPCHVYWLTPGPVTITGTVVITGQVEITNWPTVAPTPTIWAAMGQSTALAALTAGVTGEVPSTEGETGGYTAADIEFWSTQDHSYGCPINLPIVGLIICVDYTQLVSLNLGLIEIPVDLFGYVTLGTLVLTMVRRR